MTEPMSEVVPQAGDARRACALLLHYAENNTAGVTAVLQETADTGRLVELLLQVLHISVTLQPELRSELSLGWLQQSIMSLASIEHEPPPFRPARRW